MSHNNANPLNVLCPECKLPVSHQCLSGEDALYVTIGYECPDWITSRKRRGVIFETYLDHATIAQQAAFFEARAEYGPLSLARLVPIDDSMLSPKTRTGWETMRDAEAFRQLQALVNNESTPAEKHLLDAIQAAAELLSNSDVRRFFIYSPADTARLDKIAACFKLFVRKQEEKP